MNTENNPTEGIELTNHYDEIVRIHNKRVI